MARITSGAGLFVHLWNLRFETYEGFVYVGYPKMSQIPFSQATDLGLGICYQHYPMVLLISTIQSSNYPGMDSYFHPSLYPKHFLLDLLDLTFGKYMPICYNCDSIKHYMHTKAEVMASVDPRELC